MVKLPQPMTIALGKTVRRVARLRGGGSALPGLFVEHISPSFVPDTLKQLPHGVVIVSGTNGKTTTTKMVVALLESQGLRVFTNKTGSNFVRGVAAALLGAVDLKGNLPADIAVLEQTGSGFVGRNRHVLQLAARQTDVFDHLILAKAGQQRGQVGMCFHDCVRL